MTGGRNLGRMGTITNRERRHGSFEIIHIKDAIGHTFATRLSNVFVIGEGNKPNVSLPTGKGCVSPLLKRGIEDWTELDKIFEHNFALIYNVR